MTTIAQAGDFGGDFSGLRIDTPGKVHDAKAAGCRIFFRYSAGEGNASPASGWKLCEVGEINHLTRSGFDFCANSEWYESRVLEGTAAGHADGVADLRFWRSRNYSQGSVVIVSADCFVPRTRYGNLAAYLYAYQKAMQGYYLVGLYAGTPVLRAMRRRGLISAAWRANAGSWSNDGLPYQPPRSQVALLLSKVDPVVDIWQTGNYMFNKGMDEVVMVTNRVMTHNRAAEHRIHPTPTPPKPPKPKPNIHPRPIVRVRHYRVRPSDSDGLAALCRRHGISNWRRVAKLNKIPGPNFTIHVGEVLRLPGILPVKPHVVQKAVYTVRAGDTLWRIAHRWGADLEAVKRANPHAGHPVGNFNNLVVGDKITHP